MTHTHILMFHPQPAASRANAALARAAAALPGVQVVDMTARYPDDRIDSETDAAQEARALLGAGRIVLQFPVRWYSTPTLLQAWQDSVLTRMFYVAPETEGARLAGTPIMVAATAGNLPEAYGPNGQCGFAMDQILTPLRATAHRCALPWHTPFLLFEADKLDDDALAAAGARYADALRRFAGHTTERAA